ncbi:hypothetical protein [uncultured Bacteroides sp.]|nr:hypothetical protein [uncultured Bacteroides sp.]
MVAKKYRPVRNRAKKGVRHTRTIAGAIVLIMAKMTKTTVLSNCAEK